MLCVRIIQETTRFVKSTKPYIGRGIIIPIPTVWKWDMIIRSVPIISNVKNHTVGLFLLQIDFNLKIRTYSDKTGDIFSCFVRIFVFCLLSIANFAVCVIIRITNASYWLVSAGRENKCKVQNSKCKMKTNFFVSAGRVLAVPDRMREQLSGWRAQR